MANALDDWLHRLGDAPLPVAGMIREACLEVLADDRQPLSAVVPLLMQDPGLTLALLAHVNQRRRRSTHGISTVDSAVGLMGKSSVEALLNATTPIEAVTNDVVRREDFHQLRWRAFHAALQARIWSEQRHDRAPVEAATMAQLLGVGDMLLCAHDYPRYREITRIVLSQPCSDRCAERRTLGISLLELGKRYVLDRGLDESTLEGFDAMSVFNPRSVAVQLAGELARQAERSWYGPSMGHCLAVAGDFLKRDESTVAGEVHASAISAARDWLGGARPTAVGLIWPVDAEHAIDAISAPAAESRAGRAETADNPVRAIAAGETPAEVLQALVQALKAMAGLHRALFFLLGRDRVALTPRFASGIGSGAVVLKQSVKLAETRLFQQLLAKPMAVWVNPDNYEKLAAGLPRALIEDLQSRRLFVMSVFVGSQPIGAVVADAEGEALSAEDYATFKKLTLIASRRLTQLRQTDAG